MVHAKVFLQNFLSHAFHLLKEYDNQRLRARCMVACATISVWSLCLREIWTFADPILLNLTQANLSWFDFLETNRHKKDETQMHNPPMLGIKFWYFDIFNPREHSTFIKQIEINSQIFESICYVFAKIIWLLVPPRENSNGPPLLPVHGSV